jgi:rod shape-determining protein MreD
MKKFVFMISSFIMGLILMIIPLPFNAHWFKPEWSSLILVFWVISEPQLVGVGIAWCIGLLMDALKGDLLGQTALAMSMIAYLAQALGPRIRLQPFWHQLLCMLVLVGLGQLVLLSIRLLIGYPPQTGLVWLSTLSSVLVWPLVFRILQRYKLNSLARYVRAK